MLCKACRGIFEKPEWIGPGSMHKYPHSTFTKEVIDGRQNSCQLCAILCSHFETVVEPADRLELEYMVIESQQMWRSLDFWYLARDPEAYGMKHLIALISEDIAGFSPGSNDNKKTSTSETQSRVLSWMKDCIDNHTLCNSKLAEAQWYPTRLLKIEHPTNLMGARLVRRSESNSLSPYVTLSHRWGGADFLKLTIDNINDLKIGIPRDDLPKTFRDALTVAGWLGVSYIWIDSLCIIQDSAEDWAEEAGLMSEVYQNAICNIAATGALDSTGGLFFDRNPAFVRPCVVSVPNAKQQACILEKELWQNTIDKSPLIQRGWVVQERVLARRVIHFAKEQVFWECREHSACETWPKGFMHELKSPCGSAFKQKHSDVHGNSSSRLWQTIVGNYSSTQLTVPSDKEVAFNGIINLFSEKFHDHCLVGLWESQLLSQLLWKVSGVAAHCSIYRAPSWSWFSINGEVRAREYHVNTSDRDTYMQMSEATTFESVEIIEVQVNRQGTKAFSPITSAFINLRGSPRKAHCHYISERRDWQLGSKFLFLLDGIATDDDHIYVTMDNTSDPLEDSVVWLLPILQVDPKERDLVSKRVLIEGLVLEKVISGDGREYESYKRSGVFHAWGSSYQGLLLKKPLNSPQGSEKMDKDSAAEEMSDEIHSISLKNLDEPEFDAIVSSWEEIEQRSILLV